MDQTIPSRKLRDTTETDNLLILKAIFNEWLLITPIAPNDARDTGFADIEHSYHETVDGDHGRIETRRYWVTSAIEWLGAKASWSNLQSVGMVEARREIGDTVQIDTRYFLTSLPAH